MKYSRNFSDENKEKFRALNKLEMIKNICTLGNKANSDERTQNSPELEEIEHTVAQVIDNNFKQFNYCVFMSAYQKTNEIFVFMHVMRMRLTSAVTVNLKKGIYLKRMHQL